MSTALRTCVCTGLLAFSSLVCSSDQPTNAGHEGEAKVVALVGRAVYDDYQPAMFAHVYLDTVVTAGIDSVAQYPLRLRQTVADSTGYYRIDSVVPGRYVVEVVSSEDTLVRAGLIEHRVVGLATVDSLPDAVLSTTGCISGRLLEPDRYPGVALKVHILYQTSVWAVGTADTTAAFRFCTIPAGIYQLRLVPSDSTYASITLGGIEVLPGDTAEVAIGELIRLSSLLVDSAFLRDTLAARAVLDSNGISLPVAAVSQVSTSGRISQLSLAGMGLTTVTPEVGALSALEVLDLRGNYLSQLPGEVAQLSSLDALLLDDNQFTTIPAPVCLLPSLTTLRVSSNYIFYIPATVGDLTTLRELFLNDNRLTVLPAALGQLTQLQNLALQYNTLSELPREIGRLTLLSTLSLQGNNLVQLPPEMGLLVNLAKLNLEGNAIVNLPDGIGAFTALEYLSVRENRLATLTSSVGSLGSLRYLILGGNQLTALPDAMASLTNLQQLVLGSNELGTLPTGIGALSNLVLLDLADNRLCSLGVAQQTWADTYDPDWRASQRCDTMPLELVRITEPNGGETLVAGDTVTVSWVIGDVDRVVLDVLFSNDDGETWVSIAGGPLDGEGNSVDTLRWAIPAGTAFTGDTCWVKVEDYGDHFISDMCDGPFSIAAP